MAIISPRRLRYARTHQLKGKQQLIVFQIGRDYFALTIKAVARVISMRDAYGDPNDVGASLTVHQGQEMPVLDVGHQVFGKHYNQVQPRLRSSAEATEKPSGYLIIAKTLHNSLVGLPIQAQPTVRWVSLSALSPLPVDYAAKVNIQCVSSLVIEPDQPPLFLLNPEQLSQLRPHLQQTQQTVQAQA